MCGESQVTFDFVRAPHAELVLSFCTLPFSRLPLSMLSFDTVPFGTDPFNTLPLLCFLLIRFLSICSFSVYLISASYINYAPFHYAPFHYSIVHSTHLAIASKSRFLLVLQSSMRMSGGLPFRLEAVQALRMASEEVEIWTSTPNFSQAHLIAEETTDCLANPK